MLSLVVIDLLLHNYDNVPHTVNLQNYTGVDFHRSAQYSYSASKTFAVWWLKSAMLLINFHTCNFCESQSFVKNTKVKYS